MLEALSSRRLVQLIVSYASPSDSHDPNHMVSRDMHSRLCSPAAAITSLDLNMSVLLPLYHWISKSPRAALHTKTSGEIMDESKEVGEGGAFPREHLAINF